MSKAINYQDQEGNPTTLYTLVRTEPDWAASRINFMNNKIAELEKDISIAAKIMTDITNAQTVTDGGYTAGYLVTNKMMNVIDVFISKALKEGK